MPRLEWPSGTIGRGVLAMDDRLRLIEEAIRHQNDMVLIADTTDATDPRILFVNEAFERVTGYCADDVIGRSPSFLQGPATQGPELERIREAIRAKEPVRAELINYAKDGSSYWVEIDIVPIVSDDGRAHHFVSVQRDITERRRNEELRAWLGTLLNHATDAIIAHDDDGKILYWNRTAARLYGWTEDEATGANIFDLIAMDRRATDKAMAQVRTKGRWSGRMTDKARSGMLVATHGTWSRVPESLHLPAAVLRINTNITEKLVLDEEFNRARRLEAVGNMTGGVAHDFNNMLTVILGSMDLAESRVQSDPYLRQLLDLSRDAAEKGQGLVKQLLAFARRQQLDPVEIDLNALIADMQQMIEQTLGGDTQIGLFLENGLWPIEADPGQVENAIVNLCINAHDAIESGGRLTIETTNATLDRRFTEGFVELDPGDYVVLAITDNGCGMPSDVVAKVFEPFFTTKGGEGSGLGLSMVYGFLKQSGGTVTIYSEPDIGTTVRLYFPRCAPAKIAHEVPARITGDLEPASGRILLVEDNDIVRAHVRLMMESLGYEVAEAATGGEALSRLQTAPKVDIVFTDVVMPGGMDGIALAAEVHKQRPKLPVVFTSGYSEHAILREPQAPAREFLLAKPYRLQELAKTLRRAAALGQGSRDRVSQTNLEGS